MCLTRPVGLDTGAGADQPPQPPPPRYPEPRAQRHADGADGADEPPEPPPQPRADSSDGAVDGADDPPNPALTALDNPPTFAADAASRTFFRWLDKSRLYDPRSAFRPVGCFFLSHTARGFEVLSRSITSPAVPGYF